MKRQTKLISEEQAQHQAAQHNVNQETVREFNSVEEMLRHDALHTPVPPTIAHRLEESIGPVALPPRSWWQRLFGGSKP